MIVYILSQIRSQVLWISDHGNPDLGGTNEEDSCYADEVSVKVCPFLIRWENKPLFVESTATSKY